tara:strand:+ start:364 stop:591 length:228 start_codon:yes stop_codon:yes gene_type:complete
MILFFILACMKPVGIQYEIEYPCDIREGENIMGGIVDQVDNGIVAVTFDIEKILYFNCNDILQYVGRGPDYEALQ